MEPTPIKLSRVHWLLISKLKVGQVGTQIFKITIRQEHNHHKYKSLPLKYEISQYDETSNMYT